MTTSPDLLTPETYELLGAFYLGAAVDEDPAAPRRPLLYDSRDLTTHGVVMGMTGSGKTGLCVTLLEEAAIDGIPSLVIDPKGDMANLLLGFPELKPEDFRPWIDPGEAMREGASVDEYAGTIAQRWRRGLADWGQQPERIRLLHDTAEVALYTPGGHIATPLAVLRSFAAPPREVIADFEAFRQRVAGTVQGLLALLGIDADPLTSREYMLFSNLLEHAWRQGQSLDLAGLLRQVQAPPFQTLGVMDLEMVFPAKDRLALAMRMNGLLASPGFAVWSQGEPMEIDKLLWTAEGKPRVAVLSIAHLSDAERMFFVTSLLNEVVSWMRTQPGTSSLRAMVYMDEVFGYLPPVANPPSKLPLLTLLKQARAFGVGVLLATQNPVDLDYKALSNIGTWWLGRLQTERDVARVLDGLEGAAASSGASFDRSSIEQLLAGLGKRQFLMRNVHDDAPVLFQTRWALSYLRGPMAPAELGRLARERPTPARPPGPDDPVKPASKAAPKKRPPKKPEGAERPIFPSEVREVFLTADGAPDEGERLVYRPGLWAEVECHYTQRGTDLDHWETVQVLVELGDTSTKDVWEGATARRGDPPELAKGPVESAGFSRPPPAASKVASYRTWEKSAKNHLYRERILKLRRCKALKLVGRPGEDEATFRRRLREACHEVRDRELEKLRTRYAPKLERIEDRIRRAEEKVEVEKGQVSAKQTDTAMRVGSTLLGALFGRKLFSSSNFNRVSSTARSATRISKEQKDVERAEARVEDLRDKLAEMERELEDKIEDLKEDISVDAQEIEVLEVKPRKSDLAVNRMALAWMPWFETEDGARAPGFKA